jgi:hypothetical protein
MDTLASDSMPLDEDETAKAVEPDESKTMTGGSKEIKWQVVAKEPGLAPAQIIANRLIAEGIPARAWQEGAGQAFGLTVGLLGTGYVAVPEEFEEEAKAILAMPANDDQIDPDGIDEIE